jgi:hypothetical protein
MLETWSTDWLQHPERFVYSSRLSRVTLGCLHSKSDHDHHCDLLYDHSLMVAMEELVRYPLGYHKGYRQ